MRGGVAFTAIAAFAATSSLAACGGDDGPGCRIAEITTFASTPLTSADDVRVERAGADLVLFGSDAAKNVVRFARVTPAGTLGEESAVAVPTRVLGPVFAATAKVTPGDQLVVVFGVTRSPTAIALQFIVAGAGLPASAPAPLLAADGAEILLDGEPARFALAMGSTRSGKAAALVWGDRTSTSGPRVLLVKGDGITQNPATSIGIAGAPWDCLAVVPGRADFAVQRVLRTPGDDLTWSYFDFREDGSASYTLSVQPRHLGTACPVTTPTPSGYAFAWQNREGSYFTDVDATGPAPLITADIGRAAVHFGGPDSQPSLSCIASMGKDYAMIFGQSAGPLVHRFDVFGVPRGGYLYLPSRGRTGLATSWPDLGSAVVTYFDHGATAETDQRQLVRVDCPVDPP